MSDFEDSGGSHQGGYDAYGAQSLLPLAEKLRDDAKTQNLEFIAYLADMTVMEIKREIERQDPTPEN